MEPVTDYGTLSQRYSIIKNELDEAEKSLTKLLGGDRSKFSVSSGYKQHPVISSGRNLSFQQASTRRSKLSNSPDSDEESPSEDELPSKKAALQSAVVAKVEGAQSRKEVICKQNSNRKIQSRNRRILGMVQSTLQKFQDEEIKRQPQDLKRIKALEKVEAAEEEEKKLIKRQKIELFSQTKEKRLELNCLEKMMKITESFELWENNQKYLLNYIVTKAEPQIFFFPATPTISSKKHLEGSRVEIKENIEKRRADMEMALAKIRESFQLSALVSTEEKKTNSVAKVDSSQKIPVQITETYAEEEKAKLPEEILSLDLSEDESDFLIKMLY